MHGASSCEIEYPIDVLRRLAKILEVNIEKTDIEDRHVTERDNARQTKVSVPADHQKDPAEFIDAVASQEIPDFQRICTFLTIPSDQGCRPRIGEGGDLEGMRGELGGHL